MTKKGNPHLMGCLFCCRLLVAGADLCVLAGLCPVTCVPVPCGLCSCALWLVSLCPVTCVPVPCGLCSCVQWLVFLYPVADFCILRLTSCNSPWALPCLRGHSAGYCCPRCNKFVLPWAATLVGKHSGGVNRPR